MPKSLDDSLSETKYQEYQSLLEHSDIDINQRLPDGKTPFLKLLSEHSKNQDIQDSEFFLLACKFIKRPDLNINAQDSEGNTAFLLLSKMGEYKLCAHLAERKEFNATLQNIYGESGWNQETMNHVFPRVVFKKNNELAIKMIEAGVDINFTPQSRQNALLMASDADNEEMLDILLSRKEIDVNTQDRFGETVLSKQIRKNNPQRVSELLKRQDINPHLRNDNGLSNLEVAVKTNSAEAIYAMALSRKYDMNEVLSDGYPAVISALKRGSCLSAQALVQSGMINVNVTDEKGNTPSILAAASQQNELLKDLITAKADLHICNKNGDDTFVAALKGLDFGCIKQVLDSKRYHPQPDSKGYGMLQHLASNPNVPPRIKNAASGIVTGTMLKAVKPQRGL